MKTAILGASGLVGRTMLSLLAERTWLTAAPRLLVSARSAGVVLPYRGQELVCREVGPDSFVGLDIAVFSAGGGPSRLWAPVAAAAGAWVVDNSSAWRMDQATSLVVPEINGALVRRAGGGTGGIIANPNCSTIQIAMAVAPLDRAFGVREVQVTTLQAVSGAGQAAVAELEAQNAGRPGPQASLFPRPMAHNAIPAIGARRDDGSYEEETKVGQELRKILGRRSDLQVSCTATRVPVYNGHSAAVRVVCERPLEMVSVLAALADWPGVLISRDPHEYATAREMSGRTEVHVGRIRRDPDNPRALLMWVVADNLLKGAAWNAVQIADLLAGSAGDA
jgi:aspartate-semialdehyde dehydrogenase